MFEKTMNVARKYSAALTVGATTLAVNAHAQAASYDPIFDAIDFSGIATKVLAIGVVIIGFVLIMKAITLGKKAVNKA